MSQKSKGKQIIRDQGLRISPDSFDGINREVTNLILQMCGKVKEDNMKTLQIQHTQVSGVQSTKTEEDKQVCNRCGSIPDFAMRAAVDIRSNAEDYGKILLARWRKEK